MIGEAATLSGLAGGEHHVMGDVPMTWVATDGSVQGSYTGWGWLASTGDYGLDGFRHYTGQIGAEVVLISELRAIAAAVRALENRRLTIWVDSKSAVAMVKRWMAGDVVLPKGYTAQRRQGRIAGRMGKPAGLVLAQEMIRASRSRLTVEWTPGHRGEPLNEGADALARLACRSAAAGTTVAAGDNERRANGLAEAFAEEFRRAQQAPEIQP